MSSDPWGLYGKGGERCPSMSPDGKHRCAFGAGHAASYHSFYPLEWNDAGQWILPTAPNEKGPWR
jgi:hypothetical protein